MLTDPPGGGGSDGLDQIPILRVAHPLRASKLPQRHCKPVRFVADGLDEVLNRRVPVELNRVVLLAENVDDLLALGYRG
jgi:hypothetical protein